MTSHIKGRLDFHPVIEHEYVIESTSEIGEYNDSDVQVPLFWSSKDGWVPFFSCDKYTYGEATKYNLPLDSQWVSCMTTVKCTMIDGAYLTTEVSNLQPDPNLYVGNTD